jgi:protease IV
MRESILYVSFRAFFRVFFSVIGFGLGMILVLAMITAFSGTADNEPEAKYAVKIAPNAKGVRKNMSKDVPVILKVDISGVIGSETLNMTTIRQMLVESREDTLKNDRVKAILLTMQTPGGTVIDADGIYHAVKSYKEQYKVPVYAYVDGLCASGGMYVASAADKIYASEVSLIGSIGVIAPSFLNLTNLLEKIGVASLTLYAGKGKDDLNPLRAWKPGEQDSYQSIINTYYNQFVDIVTSNRPELNKKKLVDEYGANIFPAKTALEYGYIDGSGISYSDTLKEILKDIAIEDDNYQVVEMESKSWLSNLLNGNSMLFTGKVKHQLALGQDQDLSLMNKYLYLYQPGQ